MDWKETLEIILEKKHAIRHILKDVCHEVDGCVVIHDSPMKIEIHEREIIFLVDDEIAGILSHDGIKILNAKAEKEIEYWCTALSSLGFKRYSIKRR